MPNRFEELGDRLVERVVSMHGMGVEVGFNDALHRSGLTNNELALILLRGFGEQGKGRWIPPRDFVTPFREEIKYVKTKLLQAAATAVLKGRDPRPSLERLRVAAHEALTRVMDTFYDPANAPRTIKRKGRDDPLDDQGDLIASIESRVIHVAAAARSRRPRR